MAAGLQGSAWVAAIAAAMTAGAAAAQAPDAERGAILAGRWCTACHMVDRDASIGTDAGPSFASLAAAGVRTDGQLRAWLIDPHDPMPPLELSDRDVADLVAHIRSLGE